MTEKKLEIRNTGDGSNTLYVTSLREPYHSMHGAVNESMHVFIRSGLHHVMNRLKAIRILEVGMGTGLNVLLTFIESSGRDIKIEYTAIEPYPVRQEYIQRLNYTRWLERDELESVFQKVHSCESGKRTALGKDFHFTVFNTLLQDHSNSYEAFDLFYFDAFSPEVQPELWTLGIFTKLAEMAAPGGVLVTYSAKGQVRRNLLNAGFGVERLPGPTGKREMLRGKLAHSEFGEPL